MTPRQADQLIKNGKPVRVHNATYGETFTILLVKRDRYNVYTDTGGVFDRAELQVVNTPLASGPGWVVANV